MKKSVIVQIICLLALTAGVLFLGIEIFLKHMSPDRVILFAVIAGAGLLGTCGCALWRVLGSQNK